MHDQGVGAGARRDFLRSLRRSRAASFRNEIVPHFRYVFQSGFGLFVSVIFFTALVWYTDFIKEVPENWPAGAFGVAVLSLAIVRAPLRTYFQPADPAFLLATEVPMLKAYIQPALNTAMLISVLRTVAVFSLYTPIYLRSPMTGELAASRSLVATAAMLVLLGIWNVYSGWIERTIVFGVWRIALRLARWLLTLLIVAALLLKPLLLAVPFMLLCMLVIWLMWRLPIRHALPWERLIEEEAAVRRRWMAFLGWFVDVPTENSKPVYRRWIAWAGDLIPWQHRWSWHFLYAKVFLRGETFGAFIRWVVLSAIVLAVMDDTTVNAVCYGISIVVCGMQLSELRRVRFVETAATVPLAQEGRLAAAASIARMAGLGAAIGLGVIGLLTIRLEIWLPLAAAGVIWCGWWMPRKIAAFKEED